MITEVFIVDDHYMVIEGIRSLLQNEKDIQLIGHATNAASCFSFLLREQPDVILMDINMPDKNGMDLCAEVKHLYPAIAIIGLSTFNQQSYIKKMLNNGAVGYLLKNASKEELVLGIKAVVSHKTYLSHEAALALRNNDIQQPAALTRREIEVLQLIASGLTNSEIAQQLFISIATVNTHRKSLLLKLEARNTAELVKNALQHRIISFDP